MMLRLVLVGLVAGLGVTLPSQSVGHGWLSSAERWANKTLADWDTWKPTDGEYGFNTTAASVHDCEQCRRARAALALRDRENPESPASRPTRWAALKPAVVAENSVGQSQPTAGAKPTTAPVEVFGFEYDDDCWLTYEVDQRRKVTEPVPPQAPSVAQTVASSPVDVTEGTEMDLPEVLCGATEEDLTELAAATDAAPSPTVTTPPASESITSIKTLSEWELEIWDAAEVNEPVSPAAIAPIAEVLAADDPVSAWLDAVACHEQLAGANEVLVCDEGFGETTWTLVSPARLVNPEPALPPSSNSGPQPPIATDTSEPAVPASVAVNAIASTTTPQLPWPAFAPVEPTAASPVKMAQEASLPWPAFAPIEAPARQENVATARDHSEREPSPVVSDRPGTETPPAPVRGAHIDRAVDLTRQAMRAWLGVLVRADRVEVTVR